MFKDKEEFMSYYAYLAEVQKIINKDEKVRYFYALDLLGAAVLIGDVIYHGFNSKMEVKFVADEIVAAINKSYEDTAQLYAMKESAKFN